MKSAKKNLDMMNKSKLCQSEVERLFLVAADRLGQSGELEPQYPALGYHIDFAIVDKKIAIEIDGHDYHKTIEQRTHDAKRDRALDLDGSRIIRFTGSEVHRDAIACAKRATIEGSSNQISTQKKTKYERFCELYPIAKTIDNINSGDGSIDDKSLQINPQETQNLHDHALTLSKEGNYEESIKIFEELIKKNPSFICAYNNMGGDLNSLSRHEEAIRCFEIALKKNNLDAIAWANKGVALSGLDRYEEAIRCYDEALRIRNPYTFALNQKGIALAKIGRIKESFACFDTIFRINSKLPSNAPVV
jgi:tetratricopeptide (TPR) repeat protein